MINAAALDGPAIDLANVEKMYRGGVYALRGISMRVGRGEVFGLLGPNGAGKSTLLNLVPRFWDATGGRVLVDGRDVRSLRQASLRSRIAMVLQETFLFSGTVLDNVRYGRPDASREEARAAAAAANALDFIETELPDGWETQIGERGVKLSGGQRQRISIARAFLVDPEILILDEATSQIDLESEQLIHKVLEQFIRHRTAVIITHRLATLALADRVIVMNAGQIIDLGTHEQLIARCDVYRRLHQIQFQATA